MDHYKVVGKIGEGAHGLVLRGQHLDTGQEVALKKVLLKRLEDGIPNTVIREIKALQEVDCEYVVQLLDVFPQGLGFVFVFEFMPSGLWEMLRDAENPLTIPQIKTYMIMLLKGVAYLHEHSIMHRDLKPANLLISKEGVLKIADLGLGRMFWEEHNRPYSHQVATRWYRAPELLYGARYYTEAVDLWAVGCILGELLTNSPLFPGETDIEQLAIVLKTLGTPTTETWPGLTELPDYNKITFPETRGVGWDQIFPDCSPEAIDLTKKFLLYNSDKRIKAKQALVHPYFFTPPLPCQLSNMPKPTDGHRQQFKSKEYDTEKPVQELFSDLRKMLSS
ncbi:cyclin-dependent kinase 20 [Periplaneta americana]|uniref:cyclin-dependent kinase 20 n=1 Tax=Periplaneta americana TaxID=6978 RepID=UPI0037E92C66